MLQPCPSLPLGPKRSALPDCWLPCWSRRLCWMPRKPGGPGKWLAKQAGKVRAAVADASFAAQQQRQLARAAAAADALLADELPELLAEIDAAEAAAYAAPRKEVYVGFYELASSPPAAAEVTHLLLLLLPPSLCPLWSWPSGRAGSPACWAAQVASTSTSW